MLLAHEYGIELPHVSHLLLMVSLQVSQLSCMRLGLEEQKLPQLGRLLLQFVHLQLHFVHLRLHFVHKGYIAQHTLQKIVILSVPDDLTGHASIVGAAHDAERTRFLFAVR